MNSRRNFLKVKSNLKVEAVISRQGVSFSLSGSFDEEAGQPSGWNALVLDSLH